MNSSLAEIQGIRGGWTLPAVMRNSVLGGAVLLLIIQICACEGSDSLRPVPDNQRGTSGQQPKQVQQRPDGRRLAGAALSRLKQASDARLVIQTLSAAETEELETALGEMRKRWQPTTGDLRADQALQAVASGEGAR